MAGKKITKKESGQGKQKTEALYQCKKNDKAGTTNTILELPKILTTKKTKPKFCLRLLTRTNQ